MLPGAIRRPYACGRPRRPAHLDAAAPPRLIPAAHASHRQARPLRAVNMPAHTTSEKYGQTLAR